jgi:hypothetical protein
VVFDEGFADDDDYGDTDQLSAFELHPSRDAGSIVVEDTDACLRQLVRKP